jgi:two-component system response regulator AtoC
MEQLQRYHWPGNVRELENLMRRYVILGTEDAITNELGAKRQDVFNADIAIDGPVSLKKITRQATREIERKVILRILEQNNWNRKRAARALSISYRALLYKIRDVGLPAARSGRPMGSGVAEEE